LTNVVIGKGVTYLGELAFGYCSSLISVYFTGNAPTFGPSAFRSDSNAIVYYLPGASGWSNTYAGLPAVLWNALIQTGDGRFGVRNNQFGFNITGTTNIPIEIEACTNLANPVWTPLQTVTLTNGLFYFSEPFQSNNAGRFYRITAP